MPVYLLDDTVRFPPPAHAEPSGLLAIGGDLRPERLIEAYKSGIFPWFSEDDPILWFSPDPRLVIFPDGLSVSKKLQKTIRQGELEVRFDTSFREVVESCAKSQRKGQSGTWITDDMISAYSELHKRGYAHSVETYFEGDLVGGLYGVSLGGAFFGESMFFEKTDASKVALYYLVERLKLWDFDFIDSQVPNEHMKSMGGKEVDRDSFLSMLDKSLEKESRVGSWTETH